MTIRFDGQVAIVTGAGNGLGRSHVLALAERGAKVVVNDLGVDNSAAGGSSEAALEVVRLIEEKGGEAIANGANVAHYESVEAMVHQAMDKWGRVDILINNAGILRDKSFSKMTPQDFGLVIDVHLKGSFNCTKAVWDIMKAQEYGRIVMTTSSSGLYGNFGQANYSAAKAGVVGLMNTLVLEGNKYNIHVNALSPTAATRMTEGIVPEEMLKMMTQESVTAGLLTLCYRDAPTRYILGAGAGGYARASMIETDGIYLPPEQQNPEEIVARFPDIDAQEGQQELTTAVAQTEKFVKKAIAYSQD